MPHQPDSRLPLLVGICGKRSLDDSDSQNDENLMAAFVVRFRMLVRRLDKEAPTTPKILLCGGAAGVDIHAAETVLEEGPEQGGHSHPLWSVALVLPLTQALFEQDFSGAYAPYLPRFHKLVANTERVVCKELRPLRCREFDDSRFDATLPDTVPIEHLDRSHTGFLRHERRAHYEQHAIWLARQSGVFVAACCETGQHEDASAGDFAPGSTERTMAIRRSGLPDAQAMAVIRRSQELPTPDAFEDPRGAVAFWIDPATLHADPLYPARLLLPMQTIFDVRPGHIGPAAATRQLYEVPWRQNLYRPVAPTFKAQHDESWTHALALLRGVERFNAALGGEAALPCGAALGAEHPVSYLARIRPIGGPIGRQQKRASDRLKITQRCMAALFLAAIAMEETYTELAPHNPLPLALYLGALLAIAALVCLSRRAGLQKISEDYRGMSEMLRVQLAWWAAGIDRMVDRVHLRQAESDLARLRDVASSVSMWALIRFTPTRGLDIHSINAAMPPPPAARDGTPHYVFWIRQQAEYFFRRSHSQRQVTALVAEAFSATLRATFCSLALLLGAVLVRHASYPHVQSWPMVILDRAVGLATPGLAVLLLLSLFWLGFILCGPAHRREDEAQEDRHRTGSLRAMFGIQKTLPRVVVAAAILALLSAQLVAAYAAIRDAPPMPEWLGYSEPYMLLGSAGFAAALLMAGWSNALDKSTSRSQRLVVRRAGLSTTLISTLLLVATLYAAACALAIGTTGPVQPSLVPEFLAVLKEWLLVCTALLLTTTGMIRWYSDSRNHLAQAAHYDDLLRAFRRGEELMSEHALASSDTHVQDTLHDSFRHLGELALAENETWLRAHRQRPLEAMG